MNWEDINTAIFLAVNNKHSDFLDTLMLAASDKISLIPVFIICVYYSIQYFKKRKDNYPIYLNSVILIGTLTTLFLFCFYALPEIFRALFPMEKPCQNPSLLDSIRLLGTDCNSTKVHSFYGYRSCLVWFFTTFIIFALKNDSNFLKAALIIWCCIVSYSRIYVGAHYPSNVVLSNIIGIGIGYIGYRLYCYFRYNLFAI